MVSTATMSRAIRHLPGSGHSRKSPPAQERDKQIRGLWRWLASRFDAGRLVFVDESGFHTSMTRPRARAPRGQGEPTARSQGPLGQEPYDDRKHHPPRGYGCLHEHRGRNDSEVFEAYVECFLAPTLTEGQVVLDDLGAHRNESVRELVEATCVDRLYPFSRRRVSQTPDVVYTLPYRVRPVADLPCSRRPFRSASGTVVL